MAKARSASGNADADLIQAFIAYKRHMQESFPTEHRLETIGKLERGEPVHVPVIDLWQAAFRARLPCESDLHDACTEPLIVEISRDGVFAVGLDEDNWHDKPSGKRNQHRDAVNTRWLRRG